MNQLTSLDKTIDILRSTGLLTEKDTAQIEIARGLAEVVDGRPNDANIWRQYREAVKDLFPVGTPPDQPMDEALKEFFGA
jgi:hypothetical protein